MKPFLTGMYVHTRMNARRRKKLMANRERYYFAINSDALVLKNCTPAQIDRFAVRLLQRVRRKLEVKRARAH